jgi:hypothetical protein
LQQCGWVKAWEYVEALNKSKQEMIVMFVFTERLINVWCEHYVDIGELFVIPWSKSRDRTAELKPHAC